MDSKVVVPRLFALLDEVENGEKGLGDMTISYGLKDKTDPDFKDWVATIIGPAGTKFDSRIINLEIHAGPDHPMVPPHTRFITKVNLPCVNQTTGVVEPHKFHLFKNWNPTYTFETILVNLKKEMTLKGNKDLPQPDESATF